MLLEFQISSSTDSYFVHKSQWTTIQVIASQIFFSLKNMCDIIIYFILQTNIWPTLLILWFLPIVVTYILSFLLEFIVI